MAVSTMWNQTTDLMSSSSLPFDVTTSNETDPYHVISAEDRERIVAICIIMGCTLLGNLVLIISLLCRRSKRVRRVNIFLINLAFGDLAVAMFVNSTEILFIAFGDWVLGSVVCKVIVYVQMVCLASATNLLTAMSLDRYQVIVKPMESLRERPRVLLKIAVAWALSLIFPIPQLFIFVQYNDGLKADGTHRRICGSKGYTAPWQRKAYFTFTTTYILIIPMAIMVYCYMKIIHVVWVRANMNAMQFKSSQRQHRQNNHHPPGISNSTTTSTSAAAASSSAAAASTTRSLASPAGKTSSVCNSRESGRSSSGVPSDVRKDDKKRGVSHTPRFMGRPGQIHVKWASNDRNSSKNSSTNCSHNLQQCHSGAGFKESKGKKKYGSARVSVRRNLMASKRRALFMTLSVVVSFLVCLTPYFFLSLLRIYSDYQVKMETAKVISEFMVMIHSSLNPLLYGLFSLRKHHLRYLFPLLFCTKNGGRTIESKNVKEMECLGRRKHKGKVPWRDTNQEISTSTSGRSFMQQLGDSPKSISTCTSSSSSALSRPSRNDFSQSQTKDQMFQTAAFIGIASSRAKADCLDPQRAEGTVMSAIKNQNESNISPSSLSPSKHVFHHHADISPVEISLKTNGLRSPNDIVMDTIVAD